MWLGSWAGCTDPPVDIEWSSGMVKILGVFAGSGNVEEANWRPRITAVENVLNSWRQRSLSYGGRALVINALVLSRVWYVVSLIHVPRWVGVELNSLVFKFFWAGKRDLVARRVVVQPRSLGGFAVVDFFSKVSALHVQWVRRFLVSPSLWVSFMVFWFSSVLGSPPHAVFAAPGAFALGGLPHSIVHLSHPGLRVRDPFGLPVLASALVFSLARLNRCLVNLLIGFFSLSWLFLPTAWRSFFLFLVLFIGLPLGVSFSFLISTVPLLTFPGRLPMGFSILPNVCPLLVTIFLCLAFVLLPVSLCSICSLTVRSPSAFCLGFSRFSFVRHRCLLPSWFVMSCLVSLATSCVSSLVSLCTFSTFVSFVFGGPVMTSASAMSVRLLLMSWIVSRLVSASISRCSSVAFPPIVAAVFSSVSGVLVVILLQSSMAASSFIFSLLFGIPVLCAGLVGRLVTLGSAEDTFVCFYLCCCVFLLCLIDVSACLCVSCSSCLAYLSHWFGAGFDSTVKLTSWCSPV